MTDPLRIMTFNIRYGTAPDGRNAWPFRQKAAIRAINSFGPHILAVQEALRGQNEEIMVAFPSFIHAGVGRDDGVDAGEFASIFYDRFHLELEDSGTFWFSDSPNDPGSRHPECFHPRICTWAVFKGGFSVYNLHLDNVSSDSRIAAVEQLLGAIKPNIPSIITGDFNAGETDPCIELLRNAGFRDSFRQVQPDAKQVRTYHGFGTSTATDKIDFVWVDANWQVEDAQIQTGQIGGRWPSDHYPVTATLSWI